MQRSDELRLMVDGRLNQEHLWMQKMRVHLELRVRVIKGWYDLGSVNEEEPSPIDMIRVDL